MTRFAIYKALLLISLIPLSDRLSAQAVKCYTREELELIAEHLVRGQECDTLLAVAHLQIGLRDSVIADKDSQLALTDKVRADQEKIIAEKTAANIQLGKTVEKQSRRLKLTKLGWLSTSVLLAGLLFVKLI